MYRRKKKLGPLLDCVLGCVLGCWVWVLGQVSVTAESLRRRSRGCASSDPRGAIGISDSP